MSNKNVELDAVFMEQCKELTDEELENVVGGSLQSYISSSKWAAFDYWYWSNEELPGSDYFGTNPW